MLDDTILPVNAFPVELKGTSCAELPMDDEEAMFPVPLHDCFRDKNYLEPREMREQSNVSGNGCASKT